MKYIDRIKEMGDSFSCGNVFDDCTGDDIIYVCCGNCKNHCCSFGNCGANEELMHQQIMFDM